MQPCAPWRLSTVPSASRVSLTLNGACLPRLKPDRSKCAPKRFGASGMSTACSSLQRGASSTAKRYARNCRTPQPPSHYPAAQVRIISEQPGERLFHGCGIEPSVKKPHSLYHHIQTCPVQHRKPPFATGCAPATLIISVSIHPILFRRKISNYLQRCYPSASYSVTVRTGREPPHTAKIASTPRHTDRWLRPDGLRHRPHPEQKRAPLLPPGTADRTWHEEHGTGRKKRSAEKSGHRHPATACPGVLPGASHKKNAQAPARALQIVTERLLPSPFHPACPIRQQLRLSLRLSPYRPPFRGGNRSCPPLRAD